MIGPQDLLPPGPSYDAAVGEMALRAGDLELAERIFLVACAGFEVWRDHAESARCRLKVCAIAAKQGRIADELRHLEIAANSFLAGNLAPDAAQCLRTLASRLAGTGEREAAVDAIRRARDLHGVLGDTEAAGADALFLAHLLDRADRAAALIEVTAAIELLASGAQRAAAREFRAVLLMQSERLDESLAEAQASHAAFVEAGDRTHAAKVGYFIGNCLRFLDRHEEAAEQLLAVASECLALEESERAGAAFASASSSLSEIGRNDEAQATRLRALELLPPSAVTERATMHGDAASALGAEERFDEALVHARAAYEYLEGTGNSPQLTIAAFRLGVSLDDAGLTREAAAPLRRAMDIAADLGDEKRWRAARGQLVRVLRVAGEDAAAVEVLTAAIERLTGERDAADLAQCYLDRGRVLLKVGDAQSAARDLEFALKAFREVGDGASERRASYGLGRAHFQLQDYERALEAFEAERAAMPEDASDHDRATTDFLIGVVLKNLTRNDEAVSELRRAATAWDRGNSGRDVAVAQSEIGAVLRILTRYSEAAEADASAAARYRELGDPAREAKALHWVGVSRFLAEEYQEAVGPLRDELAIMPADASPHDQADARYYLGASFRYLGHYDDAIPLLNQAAELWKAAGSNKNRAIAANELGWALFAAGRHADAAEAHGGAFDAYAAIEDDPGAVKALRGKGKALHHAADFEQAFETLTAAIDLMPADASPSDQADARYYLGVCLGRLGRHDDAVPLLHQAADLWKAAGATKNQGIAALELGRALFGMGRHVEAAEAHSEAAEFYLAADDPAGAAKALHEEGKALREAVQFERALEVLTAAIDLMPADASPPDQGHVRHLMGIVLKQVERPGDALGWLREAAEIWNNCDDEVNRAISVNEIGSVLNELKRHAEALALMDESWPRHLAHARLTSLALTLRIRAAALAGLGRCHEAVAENLDAAALSRQSGVSADVGYALLAAARASATLERTDEAHAFFTDARDTLNAAGDQLRRGEADLEHAKFCERHKDVRRACELWSAAHDSFRLAGEHRQARRARAAILRLEHLLGLIAGAEQRAILLIEESLAEGDWHNWAQGHIQLCQTLKLSGRPSSAAEALLAALSEHGHELAAGDLVSATSAELDLRCNLGQSDQVLERIDVLLATRANDLTDWNRGQLDAIRLQAWAVAGDWGAVVAAAPAVLAQPTISENGPVEAGVRRFYSQALASLGRYAEAREQLELARIATPDVGSTLVSVADDLSVASALLTLGSYSEAEDQLRATRARASQVGAYLIVASCDHSLALHFMLTNRLDEALEHVERAIDFFEQYGNEAALAELYDTAAKIAQGAGRDEEALKRLGLLRAVLNGTGEEAALADCESTMAWSLMRLGRLNEAKEKAWSAHERAAGLSSYALLGRVENTLGVISGRDGLDDEARTHLRLAAEHYTQAGDHDAATMAHWNLGLHIERMAEDVALVAQEVLGLWIPHLLAIDTERFTFTKPADRESSGEGFRNVRESVFEMAVKAGATQTIADLILEAINSGVYSVPPAAGDPHELYVRDAARRRDDAPMGSLGPTGVPLMVVPTRLAPAMTLSGAIAGIADGTFALAPPPRLLAAYNRPTLASYRASTPEASATGDDAPALATW